jgi:Domain of unknown function (DUF4365)
MEVRDLVDSRAQGGKPLGFSSQLAAQKVLQQARAPLLIGFRSNRDAVIRCILGFRRAYSQPFWFAFAPTQGESKRSRGNQPSVPGAYGVRLAAYMADSNLDSQSLAGSTGKEEAGLARRSDTGTTGAVGATEIQAKFERLGWAPIRNESHDLGTDFIIAARDHRGFECGLIGAQAKGGASWFKKPANEGGKLLGWWFSEPNASHFDDWILHQLPHLVVLHDLETNTSYWVQVTAESAVRTGKGCKVLVPLTQTVDHEHFDALLAVAQSSRLPSRMERSSFSASASSIPPGSRLRHSMLAPRLVAPHPNAGRSKKLEPEEAIALLATYRLRDLDAFEKLELETDAAAYKRRRKDWRWKLASAFRRWIETDDFADFATLSKSAPDDSSRAAVTVLYATALFRSERAHETLAVLKELIDANSLGPTDHAWLLAHRARASLELGSIPAAITDSLESICCAQNAMDDPTAAAITASATLTLYRSDVGGAGRLADAVNASDIALNWWRSQTLAAAFNEANKREFRAWSIDSGSYHASEDIERRNLVAAKLGAELVADHGSVRAQQSLLGRHILITSDLESDLSEALDELRRSGDTASLRAAAKKIRLAGPCTALEAAATRIKEHSWSQSTAETNLEMWQHSGDLLPPDLASEAVTKCLAIARGPEDSGSHKLRPGFWVLKSALEALATLLRSAGPIAHQDVVEFLISCPVTDKAIFSHLCAVTKSLDLTVIDLGLQARLRDRAKSDETRVGCEILRLLGSFQDKSAEGELIHRAVEGDFEALRALHDLSLLGRKGSVVWIDRLSGAVSQMIQRTSGATVENTLPKPLQNLIVLNGEFPEAAEWKTVVDALSMEKFPQHEIPSALAALMENSEKIPPKVRPKLVAACLEIIRRDKELPEQAFVLDIDDSDRVKPVALASALTAAMSGSDEGARTSLLGRLATGSRHERYVLANFLGRHDTPALRSALYGLVRDEDFQIRTTAAESIGRLIASDPEKCPFVSLALDIASDSGIAMPLSLIVGLRSNEPNQPAFYGELGALLRNHPARPVSRMAQRSLSAHS